MTAANSKKSSSVSAIEVVKKVPAPKEPAEVRVAVGHLVSAGLPVLNQSVLLAGVNDDPDVLVALNQALEEIGVQPYYLHHTDHAPGTRRFWVGAQRGLEIYRVLSARVRRPPQYVIDPPAGTGKVPMEEWAARNLSRPVPSMHAPGSD